MRAQNIDAYIITMFDPHLSEYVASHWRIINWFSGFSGSAGTIVVTHDFAGLWTDSRYFIQAEKQLQGSGIELVKLKIPHTPEFIDWIGKTLDNNSKIAFDGSLFPLSLLDAMSKKFARKDFIIAGDVDLISPLWNERPQLPSDKAFIYDLKYAGKSRSVKLQELRDEMQNLQIDYQIISSLDDIAWLYNIRGNDVSFVPLVISYAIITYEKAFLFVDKNKITASMEQELNADNIIVEDYNKIFTHIKQFEEGKNVSIEFGKTNYAIYNSIPSHCEITNQLNITTRLKAVKNAVEIANIKQSMIKDGVAMVKFLYWLEKSVDKESVTELSAADKLKSYRAEQDGFFQESFGSISAYNEHAAMPHYSATPQSDVEIKTPGIYLIDSGGQYFEGTTDITRTVALGASTEQQKNDYTLALKGTIDFAMTIFPAGTKGYHLDMIARKALWDNRLNFGHGTGHGVGCFLNVHEGPQSVSPAINFDVALMSGMIVSDEPAFYRQGEYGFRTENLVLVVEDEKNEFGQFLKFETITLCPIDTDMINKKLLTKEETDWLNNYHQEVYDKISAFIDDENLLDWLTQKTKRI